MEGGRQVMRELLSSLLDHNDFNVIWFVQKIDIGISVGTERRRHLSCYS